MTYSKNAYLTQSEMKVNAQYILDYLVRRGWTKNAVCGMLGNMESESTINPGIWQDLQQGNMLGGYGLVQWTPASKYISWAEGQGLTVSSMDSQLKRILYEVENGVQWIDETMTFLEFTRSTLSPYELGIKFLLAYERPANPKQPWRGTQAESWYSLLNGSIGGIQLAQFPMDVIQVTQGENGSFSHLGTLCIDFVGTSDKYPYYAPCDCECIARLDSDAGMIWKSTNPVMCADGNIRSITWNCMHEDPLVFPVGKKVKKGELMGHTGIGGFVTGDHLHFNVIEGSEYNGFVEKPHYALAGTELHIYDVFAVNGVTIVDGGGYPWTTSDYIDGENGQPQTNNQKRYIQMLLSGSINGW